MSDSELVKKIDKKLESYCKHGAGNDTWGFVELLERARESLTTKQDGVAISSWAATEATEALKVVQADKYHMCAEYGEALSEILAALKQQEQSE